MTQDKSPPTSPVCYLPETDDRYAGYLTPDEIHTLIRQWIALAPGPEIATPLAALLPPHDPAIAISSSPMATVSGALLRAEIRRTLPRIRDDTLHHALSRIADCI